MEPRLPRGGPGLALAGAFGLAVILILGALLDLGPFADEELSRARFLAEGDRLCDAAHDAFADLQTDPPQTPAEASELTERLIAIAEDELERIEELAAPAELEPLLDRYLAARQEGIALLERGNEAAGDRDASGYADAQEALERSQRRRAELAREVGFGVCSRPLGAGLG